MPYKVTIDRDGCISCGACYSACGEFFEPNPDDDLTQVVEQYRTGGNLGEGQAPDDMESCVKEGEQVCPVEVIHVEG